MSAKTDSCATHASPPVSYTHLKKPFTVLVAVILVMVLGFVSLTGMQTDLLPNMNLPYLLVITTLSLIHI